ncbi:MAG TPA: carbamate kinase [Candidatus Polarisedimenticolia bacterium]|nr:carbamate kinase [Candidatus Polarisedimenticolia bacterium]
MLIVVALGGNALAKRGEPMSAENQRTNVRQAALSLAELVHAGHRIVVTHGNGPQVGMLALQAAAGPPDGAYPLDVLGAESEGMIGYLIEQELTNALPKDTQVAAILTQVRVDPNDPGFSNPTKPIGPIYDQEMARKLELARGWRMAPDGDHWRRVVASPKPLEILESRVIAMLVRGGVNVICAGGGGIPVIQRKDGAYLGIEAVIDKDAASALLARQLKADMLVMLTDVDAVYRNFGTTNARPVRQASVAELGASRFAAGSMGPKVQAALDFASATGKPAGIGRLQDAAAIIRGEAGTRIVASE